MSTDLRSVSDKLPRYPVVTDKGLIKLVDVAYNVTGAVFLHDGEPMISPAQSKKGWVFLEDLYRKEGKGKHWEAYRSYLAAKEAGQVPPAAPGESSFPDRLLPDEVLRRRGGEVPNRKTWTPPAVDETPNDETAKKSRKGRKGDHGADEVEE